MTAQQPKDMRGRLLAVGQQVAKATVSGACAYISLRKVTRIEGSKVYLDTKVPLTFPDRVLIID